MTSQGDESGDRSLSSSSQNSTSGRPYAAPSSEIAGRVHSTSSSSGQTLDNMLSRITDGLFHHLDTQPFDETDVQRVPIPQPPDMLEIARELRDRHIADLLMDFSAFLLSRVDKMDSLAGIEHRLRVYPFESMEDDSLTFIRVELQIPGLSGDPHRDIWMEYCNLFGEALKDYLKKIKPTTKQGRQFRSIVDDLSEGIGTF